MGNALKIKMLKRWRLFEVCNFYLDFIWIVICYTFSDNKENSKVKCMYMMKAFIIIVEVDFNQHYRDKIVIRDLTNSFKEACRASKEG